MSRRAACSSSTSDGSHGGVASTELEVDAYSRMCFYGLKSQTKTSKTEAQAGDSSTIVDIRIVVSWSGPDLLISAFNNFRALSGQLYRSPGHHAFVREQIIKQRHLAYNFFEWIDTPHSARGEDVIARIVRKMKIHYRKTAFGCQIFFT
ncbi:hypothetical protein CJ030_MR6G020499 [Morella rubra]|uniref:Uncharacterized protein n=1 Tax=Morella rubra TaxID=262757 RepID=A0A6A1V9J9_9ROSI|nr:hypothetical protein CJ030_MR6G020499 [Morella rubra]